MDLKTKTLSNKRRMILTMILYLAGIFMGAIDTGIVTPARTIIQTTLGADAQLGIWMITIYTLAYASSIPIMGKIADKYGRKYIYLLSILLFGMGSLLSGLSQYVGSFTMLLIARAIQALGGGGIVPIATAEFGTTFPKEKRGIALGLVGGIYGIANIFGASAGSLILDLFGHDNWSYIFFINVPITIFILLLGFFILPNNKSDNVKRIDVFGILFLTMTILSLLYGLKNINFLDFWASFTNYHVWLFLLISILLLPIFVYAETKAEDPVMNLSYFKNRQIVITLLLSFISGIILMGTIFVPQFAENSVRIATGSGGYFVIVLGLFAGIGAPLSGRLIDKFGVKPVLGFGFSITVLAALFVVMIAIPHPSTFTVIVSLVLMGLGLGFSLGTPLNYMMLENTKATESNSALATLSLIRSIGTTIAPSIMVAFLASAGMMMQTNIQTVLPDSLTIPPVEYASEINEQFTFLKQDPRFSDSLSGFDFPDMSVETEFPLNMSSSSGTQSLDPSIISLIQGSDVTTVGENTRIFYQSIFNAFLPIVVMNIQSGVQSGIDGINDAISQMNGAYFGLTQTVTAFTDMADELSMLPSDSFDGTPVSELVSAGTLAEVPSSSLSYLEGITTLSDLNTLIASLQGQAMGLSGAITNLNVLVDEMIVFKSDVETKFNVAKNQYLDEITAQSDAITSVFQSTLNKGFRNIYLVTMSTGLLGFIVLQLYQPTPKKTKESSSQEPIQ